jgi:hypothetical protein
MSRFAKILLSLGLCLGLSLPALAERKVSFADLEVHYNALNSSFLQPDVAAAKELVRSKNQGVLNIAILKAGKASTGNVTGSIKDLASREQPLTFRQVSEGEAIYYLAQFPITHHEQLRFSINLSVAGGESHSFEFNQEVFPD